VESELSAAIDAWRRAVNRSILGAAMLSVSNAAAGLVAGCVLGFVPADGHLALATQLSTDVMCAEAHERRQKTLKQRLEAAENVVPASERVCGAEFVHTLDLWCGCDVLDGVLHVVCRLARERQRVDAKRAEADLCDLFEPRRSPAARTQDKRADAFCTRLRSLHEMDERHRDGVLQLLTDVTSECVNPSTALVDARAVQLLLLLLYFASLGLGDLCIAVLDAVRVGGTVRDVACGLGRWLAYSLFAVTVTAGMAALLVGLHALSVAARNYLCGRYEISEAFCRGSRQRAASQSRAPVSQRFVSLDGRNLIGLMKPLCTGMTMHATVRA